MEILVSNIGCVSILDAVMGKNTTFEMSLPDRQYRKEDFYLPFYYLLTLKS